MTCSKCKNNIDADSIFCKYCGKKLTRDTVKSKRGNGQGSVWKLPNGNYRAQVVLERWIDEDGNVHKRTRSKDYAKKADAVAGIQSLYNSEPKLKTDVTFRQLYDAWEPTHKAGKSTMDCYHAAWRYFNDICYMKMQDIDVDDLQECIDNCGHGKRTQENMRAVAGLVYKYGIPRGNIPRDLNLAQFLKVSGDNAAHRSSFNDLEIEKLKKQIGKTFGADYIYIMIYTGFRPSEFLSITPLQYDAVNNTIRAGGKTDAGTNRTVTLSPKVAQLVDDIYQKNKDAPVLFANSQKKAMRLQYFTEEVFYPVLDAAEIDNPIIEISGEVKRHKYSPHSCRHTFSTLMKRVTGSDKDKLELIGHTSGEMLRYYQDVELDDLRKITDAI